MRTVYLVLAFIVGVLLTVFGFQNTGQVRVTFLGWNTDYAPLALVILASAITGAALAWLLTVRGRVRDKLELRRRGSRVHDLESQSGDQSQVRLTPPGPEGTP